MAVSVENEFGALQDLPMCKEVYMDTSEDESGDDGTRVSEVEQGDNISMSGDSGGGGGASESEGEEVAVTHGDTEMGEAASEPACIEPIRTAAATLPGPTSKRRPSEIDLVNMLDKLTIAPACMGVLRHADQAVRSGKWKVCGWRDGSELLAPKFCDAVIFRPKASRAENSIKRKPQDGEKITGCKRKLEENETTIGQKWAVRWFAEDVGRDRARRKFGDG